MHKVFVTRILAVGLATALSTPATASDDALKATLAGKTITMEKSVIKMRKNGRMTGKVGPNGDVKLEGAWAIRDGKWCRTIKLPESFAGTECHTVVLGDGTVSFTGSRGTSNWVIK